PPPLHRRWDHDSRVPSRRAYSTTDYHSRACTHWRWNSALRPFAARHPAPSCGNAAVSKRLGQQRVPYCCLAFWTWRGKEATSLSVAPSLIGLNDIYKQLLRKDCYPFHKTSCEVRSHAWKRRAVVGSV